MRNEEECVRRVCPFRCNIFIGFRIIKEMPGSVASGTPFTTIYIGYINYLYVIQNFQCRSSGITLTY